MIEVNKAIVCERDLIGNLYLTGTVNNGGSTGYDIHTVKIDTMMNVVWEVEEPTNRKGPSGSGVYFDEGTCMSIDGSGNVFVGGYKSTASQGTDFVTLMYDDAGSLQWAAAWNDTSDGGDTAKAIIADGNGNVVVTGAAWNGSSFDYRTVAYDYSANLQWEMDQNSRNSQNYRI